MLTMRYRLVIEQYLRMRRGNGNVVIGNLTMQNGRMHTNRTVEELPTETYPRSKFEVGWMRTGS